MLNYYEICIFLHGFGPLPPLLNDVKNCNIGTHRGALLILLLMIILSYLNLYCNVVQHIKTFILLGISIKRTILVSNVDRRFNLAADDNGDLES